MIHARLFGKTGGGTAEKAVKAIDYMTDLKNRQHLNLVATNNSYAGDGYSQALKDAIDRAGASNIVFVAAAGNAGRNLDILPQYPAAYKSPSIISVAALTSSGDVAIYSNFGEKSVDLCAPGDDVMSTVPTDSYASHSGTSMAAPHVTGAVALYAQRHPGLSARQLKAAILDSTIPTPSCAGRQKTKTGARLNVSGF